MILIAGRMYYAVVHWTNGVILWTGTSEDHIAKHNVTPDEVEEVLYGRPRLRVPGRQSTYLVLGQTAAGRYLLIVTARSGEDQIYIVTARDMKENERRLFARKGR
ncbi:BrnT family toxin [Paractinoplanes rhizophilus]|uniref:BrnT family toxin n=1 Tax=Paractinoplanes rhizophilus TaxID=1416877 RepID=A0ABW2HN08_9ACTN|nr:BrnT family toxin [Actinoplanes sp.]